MTRIPKLPNVHLSDEQKNVFNKFPEEVLRWKKFLMDNGFEVIVFSEYITKYTGDALKYSEKGGAWDSVESCESAVDNNLILSAATFACLIQFTTGRYWPDQLGENYLPIYVEALFYIDDKAMLIYQGEKGEPLFDPSKYFTGSIVHGSNVTGSWQEIATLLVSIRKEISEKLKISKVAK